jgi:hypothetical protein
MRERIDSPAGRVQYAQRFAAVEPVFGNLRANERLDRFTLRGRQKVDTQWKLYCLVHNIEKLAHAGYAAQADKAACTTSSMRIMARASQRPDKTAIIAHDITVENDPRSGTSATPTYPTASTRASAAAASIKSSGGAAANDSVR